MARAINILSARSVETLPPRQTPYADGGNLYLVVGQGGARSWLFIYRRRGTRVEMGLGSTKRVPLKKARELAAVNRALLADGLDPLTAKRQSGGQIPTFGTMADEYIAAHSPDWRNPKHRAQWTMTLSVYAAPLRGMRVDEIDTADILKVLSPIWRSKPETASRVRGRIESVLDAAAAAGHRSGANPARFKGHLENLLGKTQKLTRGHHKAMAYADVPDFVADLRDEEGTGALALRFTILTACRTGEVIGATWPEIDLEEGIWTIPAARMKARREHRVPLSRAALAVIRELRPKRSEESPYVFPASKKDRPLSNMTLTAVLKRMGVEVTVHGFRSSFRDWVAEETEFPRELAEQALAHIVGDRTERAYRRGDALERRRELMEAWAKFCGVVG